MAKVSAEARLTREPPRDLQLDVQELFERVCHIRMPDGSRFRTPSTNRPSPNVALVALGFLESSYSSWKTGDPKRDLTFTRHLLDGICGDLGWVPSNKGEVEKVWARFQEDKNNADLMAKLRSGLEVHYQKLMAANLAQKRATRSATSRGGREHPQHGLDPVSRWSDSWTSRTIEPWARGLLNRKDRVVYIYGARGSGKSVLMTALGARLGAQHGGTARIHLNVGDLVAQFRVSRDANVLHNGIFMEIAHQVAAESPPPVLGEHYNFDEEIVRVLGRAPTGPIYLLIENADACLRICDARLRKDSIDATARLFNFLRPVAQESGKPILDRISVILEGSRPLGDLAKAYPASPLNDGRPYVLRRFGQAECADLGRLAGLKEEEDLRRLHEQTGGNRSLVWAVLRSAGDEPGVGLPTDMAGLDQVAKVLRKLAAELEQQESLRQAFARVRAGCRIDFESRTRLRDCMYVDASDPPRCGCPLLETALEDTVSK